MKRPHFYVSTCPDTGRQFLVEHGKDNNIVELSAPNVTFMKWAFKNGPVARAVLGKTTHWYISKGKKP